MLQGRTLLFLLLLGVCAPLSAIERSLIDFTTFNENIGAVINKDQELYEQVKVKNPELDIERYGWPDYSFEASDWNLENWKIELIPSSNTVPNMKDSIVKNTPSKKFGNVLGVRVKFQPWKHKFWARVVMPYHLHTFFVNGKYISENDQDQDAGLALGILANVGQIMNARSWVYGLNYNYNYGLRIEDEEENVREFYFGSIHHEGWRRVVWNNPYYIKDHKDWTPDKNPLYPFSLPCVKFNSLVFYKPDGSDNPDFMGYVKDVTLDYDYALIREVEDIDDEAVWGILAESAINQRIIMSKVIVEQVVLRKNFLKRKDINATGAPAIQQNTQDTQSDEVTQ